MSSYIKLEHKPLNEINKEISHLILNLYNCYPHEITTVLISIWVNEHLKIFKNDEYYKLCLMEVLFDINIPLNLFLVSIYSNINPEKLVHKVTRNMVILNKEIIKYEAKFFHLLYSIIIFYNLDDINTERILEKWLRLLKIFNIFLDSKSPITTYWLLETYFICISKLPILEPKSDEKMIIQIVQLFHDLLKKIIDIITCKSTTNIIFEEFILINPLNPSIYKELSQLNQIQSNNETDNLILNFKKLLLSYVVNSAILSNDELIKIYRWIGFITLKRLFVLSYSIISPLDKVSIVNNLNSIH